MVFSQEIRSIRQHCFLSQEAFARELEVSFSTVNRWESGRAKPNIAAIKKIKDFCVKNSIDFSNIEKAWFAISEEGQQ